MVPDGLASHPNQPIAVLTGNRITDLPDALFDIPATRSDGIYLSDNPLSAAARDKIKAYYRLYQNDFEVPADGQDIALARQLFPDLDQQQASDMIYDLPGTLADSRIQLDQWHAELEQMHSISRSGQSRSQLPIRLPGSCCPPLNYRRRQLREPRSNRPWRRYGDSGQAKLQREAVSFRPT